MEARELYNSPISLLFFFKGKQDLKNGERKSFGFKGKDLRITQIGLSYINPVQLSIVSSVVVLCYTT